MQRPRTLGILLWLPAIVVLGAYRGLYSFDNRLATIAVLTAMDVVVLAGCSLVLNRYAIPALLYNRRVAAFAGLAGSLVVVGAYTIQAVQPLWYRMAGLAEQTEPILQMRTYQVFNSWLVVVLGCLCVIAFRLISNHLLTRRRFELLEKEKARTELSFLKAQINPHLLFNFLNSIYAHIDRSNTTARNIALCFSEMLRYQLYECSSDAIPIEKELSYLRHYIDLQSLRTNGNLRLSVETTGDLASFSIAPLLLVPFVENAFKYTSTHEHRPNFLIVQAHRQESTFSFRCENTKDHIRSHSLVEESGVGIQNVRRRLELLYPGKHTLDIRDGTETFAVHLDLTIA